MHTQASNEQFLKNLAESRPAVRLVARCFERRGYEVEVHRELVRPNHTADIRPFQDRDLAVRLGSNPWSIVEVKGQGFNFSCPGDYGHNPKKPYDPIIVDEVYKADREPMAAMYVFVSRDFKFLATLDTDRTRDLWVVKAKPAGRKIREGLADYYWCPISSLTFHEITSQERYDF